MLDGEIKAALAQYLEMLEGDVIINLSVASDEQSQNLTTFIEEIAQMSPKIKVQKVNLAKTPSFSLSSPKGDTGIVFAGIPLGHEFSSFVLALLQGSGRRPKIDEKTAQRIKEIEGKMDFQTYVSLSCHNCPDVVQALNTMAVLNPNITHTMIDGAVFKEEVEEKKIMAVPSVYLNGEFFASGRMALEEILEKIAKPVDPKEFDSKPPFDVLVIGGGPAGASAAIYTARKGVRTGIVAERFGGQILDTLKIENFISVKTTEGSKLALSLEEHVKEYDVDIIKGQKVKGIKKEELFHIELANGGVLKSKTVIIATGARWRNLGVPGEQEFKNRGVAYCPHCDGPLFAGKRVAVIGGGNSGIEAAIDLAGIVKHVTVLEFLPELKADAVLQKRLYSLPNVTVLKNVQTKEIIGDDEVKGLVYSERDTGVTKEIPLEGVFVQIGLVPNTDWLDLPVEKTKIGEIIVDSKGATNIPGLFAAGDCTNSPYKQIIISMGSGATAALAAFDYLIRN
ncbi:alkyl hydroperoxide reductase subunit F [Anaerobranca californiensis DSM 14826]|uniref:Alkyl hydroperoxide reductase subunit F n=1 Tax=Anaerobranca californiensis DSM 14826 TaxID=1120989 RepID=A0A1M6Q9W6_9FIRM|nr:alkyl hydroperoxide reductase subunit F [Anaerobranca californiensis]SHK17042.1 alkyl hydroperoxide reductase subunit F [Anaerobranca californiensis DSM 14826]